MTEPPNRFRALVADKDDDGVHRALRDLSPDDLPEGDVTVRVGWSSVNYKDALAVSPKGRVAKTYPLVPGIDLAGEVIAERRRRRPRRERPSSPTATRSGSGSTAATPRSRACPRTG